ncbi:MAG: competence/damage-inducible protein A [Candidatus Thorarchaeota archaeon]|nr:competence/damage-inducible protein A [Candidatus Thorarchaeota archaeon]
MDTRNTKKRTLTAGIIAIGNELLDGIVLETNANWMDIRLTALGVQIRRIVSVRDEIEEIGEALKFAREACDVIITSGGLGPTHDDMTLKAIAKALGRDIIENKDALKIIKRQYKMLFEKEIVAAPDLTDVRMKMAQIPEGAVPLDNRVGGAPGVEIQDGDTTIFCLPGVPAELKFIFEDSIIPWVKDNSLQKFHEQIIEFLMKDESVFAPAIDSVMKQIPRVYIKSLPKPYGTSRGIRVWLSARGTDDAELKKLVQRAISGLEEETGIRSKPVGK